ncbi:MAG TPA: PilN domain-containing protein [Rhodocyclaceae bacterium]|jgi:type IV pilus assembly protein PilN|nr:PilN domain-containing protein [Rhodocyclaceae bacterium]
MIRINLLPHREEKRKARRTQFFALMGLVAALTAIIWFVGHTIIEGQIDAQNDKNEFLRQEITVLDKQIAEIKSLKQQSEALLARKRVIELLEANRAETVHIFNEFAQRIPDGIYLRKVTQTGQTISLNGYAQANARVSALMHNLEESPLLQKPELIEIKAEVVGGKRLSAFNMKIEIKREVQQDAIKPVSKGAKP